MSSNLPNWLPSVISFLQNWLPIISGILFLLLLFRLPLMKETKKKDNFVFWFLLAINTSLTIKLFVEQADALLLAVLVLTTFLLILTLKVNSDKENERQTLEKTQKILQKSLEAQEKVEQIQQIVNKKPDVVDWQSMAVFFAILVNNAILFWKLFSSMEPQAGILITIAIMAGLLLLTLRVDSLEFQNKFPFLTFNKP
jgi:hypothetical protein